MANRGRPPKPDDQIFTARIEFRMLPEEKAAYEQVADGKLSAWIRERLNRAVEVESRRKAGGKDRRKAG